jgi:Carboxypeptidase regulatory-like domain/TonB-dependent Receptor Plug Domain
MACSGWLREGSIGRQRSLVLSASVPVLLFLVFLPVPAFAQSGIAGVVKDTTGAVLPGVTVEAASPALIEKLRTGVSDDQGRYNIIDLRPGTYTVSFVLAGFKTVKREGIELPASFTATVNAEMPVGALEETITVSAQTPLVDIQNVTSGQTLSKQVLDAVPTVRMPQTYMTLIPGVSLNPSLTGQGLTTTAGAITIHGSKARDSAVLLDGFSQSNWTNPGGQGFYWMSNPATAQEIVAVTGGAKADQDLSGIQSNIIPKEGGNRFSGQVYFHYTNESMLSDNRTAEMKAQGVQLNGSKESWDLNPAFGGPIKQDKVWFFAAYRSFGEERGAGILYNLTPTTWVYTPDTSRPPGTFRLSDRDYSLRLTWQATKRNKFSFYGSHQPRTWRSRDISSTTSPEATTWTPYIPDYLLQASWKSPVSNRLFLEGGGLYLNAVNLQRCNDRDDLLFSGPPASRPDCGLVTAVETTTGTRVRSAAVYGLGNGQGKGYRVKMAVSYITGSHTFKTGVDYQSGSLHTLQTHPGDYQVNLRNGSPVSITLFAPFDETDHVKADLGIYAEDQWTLKRLTLNLGVRYSYFNGYVAPQDEPGNSLIDPRHYDEVSQVPLWKDIVPRLGAAYDLFGNGRTAVKFTVSKYTAGETVAFTRNANPVVTSFTSATRNWTDSNGNTVPDCDLRNNATNGECGQISNTQFGQANPRATTNDPSILRGWGVRGYNWETSAAVQHELTRNLSLNVSYFHRSYGNLAVTDNTLVTPADFDPYCITAPVDSRLPGGGGNQLCGFYDVSQAKFGQTQNNITASAHYGDLKDIYNGVDIAAQFRLPNGTLLAGGTSTGREQTSNCFVIDNPGGNTPTITSGATVPTGGVAPSFGFSSWRADWCDVKPPFQTQLKLFGSYPLPWYGIQVSWNYQSLPGPELSFASIVLTNDDVRASLGRNLSSGANGTVTLPLMQPGTVYGDRWSKLDTRVTKSIAIGTKRVQGSLDIFNLFNSPGVQLVNNNYGPNWLRPTLLNGPRLFRFAAQVDF